jgi:RNA polymerase sigma-70 factor (ECF subfamily)
VRGGRGDVYEVLKQVLPGKRSDLPYQELAKGLGISEGAVGVAVHRLRARYRELLCDAVARTVETPEQVEEEIRDLFAAFAD